MQGNLNIPAGLDKIDWKSNGVNFKKIDILNIGGTIYFEKAHYEKWINPCAN